MANILTMNTFNETKLDKPVTSNREWTNYDLKLAVKLPEGEDKKEWIAINLFDFHRQVSMLYGLISDDCTRETCPQMTASQCHQYLWSHGPKRDSVALSARDYISLSLGWIQEQLDDEEVFPWWSMKKKFPDNFIEICEAIARRLIRVFAHVHHHHMTQVREVKIEAHMNTSLKHFIYFVREFNLITQKELEPLQGLTSKLGP